MLSKLLKKDLSKNMRWLWILFVATIACAGLTRGFKELGKTVAFFQVVGIFFDSVFYSLAVNAILQPFLRSFLNFKNSFYSDESYLTHTLPVTKNELINSKYLTAIIEMISGFACLVVSLIIMFISPSFGEVLKLMLSTIVTGSFSIWLVLALMVVLIFVEFFMFISIIYFGIILGFKSRDHKVLKSFLIVAAMAFASIIVLAIAMVVVLSIFGVKLSAATLVLSSGAFYSVLVTGIVVYSIISVLFYFLAKREFNKGVNVD